MTNYYFDMDGVLANFHEHKDGWKRAMYYNFIFGLKPFIGNVNLINQLLENREMNVYISSLAASEEAKKAKIDWLKKYVPNLSEDHIIIIVGKGKKHENMKTADGILIDDKESNCKQWRKAGHKAILLTVKGETINLKEAV